MTININMRTETTMTIDNIGTLPAALDRRVWRALGRYNDAEPEILESAVAAAAIVFAVWPDDSGIGTRMLAIKGAHLLKGKAIKGRLVAFPVCCRGCAIEAQARFGEPD
jgi:hypothetical protein